MAAPFNVAVKYTGGRGESGKYHGMGCLVTPSSKYAGQFQHGDTHGRGKLVDDFLGTYIGEIDCSCEQGWGVLISKDGICLESQFETGYPIGRHVSAFPGGLTIAADMQHKVLSGRLLTCPGQWCEDAFVQGRQLFTDGRELMGTVEENKLHRYGKWVWPNGVLEQGESVHGSLKAAVVA